MSTDDAKIADKATETATVVEETPAPAAEAAPAETSSPAEETEKPAPKEAAEPMSGFPGMLAAEKVNINGGNSTLIYSAPISDRIVVHHCLATQACPCSFAVCYTNELRKSSYVHLYEDRIEYSYATSICFQIVDNPAVLYLDRDVAQLSTVPDCCRPFLTHCSCCPTGFDSCGEGLFLHGENTCCFVKGGKPWGFPCLPQGPGIPAGIPCPQLCIGKPCPVLNRSFVYFPFLEDAGELKREIRKVRAKLVADGHAVDVTKATADGEQTRA